jgi:uncharacterized DUF497 family protein
MKYNFEWDTKKACMNVIKHKVTFEEAATIFKDPKALTMYDKEHSDNEDRWITMGFGNNGRLLTMVHTYNELNDNEVIIRLISARKSTKNETNKYRG